MVIRKATTGDLKAIETIFSDIHTAEENGSVTIGWRRGVYPTATTAQMALDREDLFVQEDDGKVVGVAIINQLQVAAYKGANWKYDVSDKEIMVLHTLVISPKASRKGYGQKFVSFYENYAQAQGCYFLRMDTNEKNINARTLYKKLGYDEVGIVPCVFNGLENINLVLLEKKIGQ